MDVLSGKELSSLASEGVDTSFKEMFNKSMKAKRTFEQTQEETGQETPVVVAAQRLSDEMLDFNKNLLPLIN